MTLIAAVALAAIVGALTASGVAHIVLIAAVAGLTKLFLDTVHAGIPGA